MFHSSSHKVPIIQEVHGNKISEKYKSQKILNYIFLREVISNIFLQAEARNSNLVDNFKKKCKY